MLAVTATWKNQRHIATHRPPDGATNITTDIPIEDWEPCMRPVGKLRRCSACHQLKPWNEYPIRWSEFGRAPYKCFACRTPPNQHTACKCDHCGIEYLPSRSDSRYCSGRCRTAAHRARR